MATIAGRHALLELFRQEGIDTIFGNPGSTELPLMDALSTQSDVRYVLGLHEAVVMAMADGYAQAGGRLAAVNLHAAPGLGNAMGMLYNAKKAGAPVIVTAGQQDTTVALTEPLLWDDLPTLARPLVKWATEVTRLADLPRAVHRAAKVALTPPTGPVFLSLPGDVLTQEGPLDLMQPSRVALGWRADAAAIEKAADLLLAAERPLILAGDCVAQRRAHAELVALAERIGAPVYTEPMASTASFPTSHPLFAGAIPRLVAQARPVLEQHDLIVSIGADLFTLSLAGQGEAVPAGMRIVHLDSDPWELAKNFPVEAALYGDPKASLPELAAALETRLAAGVQDAWAQRRAGVEATLAARRAALVAQAEGEAERLPLRPLALLHALGQWLPADAIVIEEVLSSAPRIRELLRSDNPQSFYGMRGAGIGWGLPAAVGAKLAVPHRPVVALVGDGSAMYTFPALWTAAHDRIPVVFMILNNRSYRILKQRAAALRKGVAGNAGFVGMDLVDPVIDYVAMAGSLGVRAVQAHTLPEVEDALRRALAAGEPWLIDVAIDPTL